MSMYNRKLGGKRIVHNFSGNDYELIDPDDFLRNMLTMDTKYYPTNWIKLFTIMLIGSMGSGKSTVINAILNVIHAVYGIEVNVIKTNDLIYSIKHALNISYFQVIIIDDAMQSGFDSRQSMSSENIDMSQNYSIGRHLAKKKMGRGILFVIFAIQSPTRLDKFIRENADLTIYKTYYPFLDKILDSEHLEYVKDFTNESMLKNNFSQLSACLGVDRIGRAIKFWFPMQKPAMPITEVEPEQEDFTPLIEELQAIYDKSGGEISQTVLKSYIFNWMEQNKKILNNKTIKKVIYKVIFNFNFASNGQSVQVISHEKENTIPLNVIAELRARGVSPYILSDFYVKSQAQLYRDLDKLEKRQEIEMDC